MKRGTSGDYKVYTNPNLNFNFQHYDFIKKNEMVDALKAVLNEVNSDIGKNLFGVKSKAIEEDRLKIKRVLSPIEEKITNAENLTDEDYKSILSLEDKNTGLKPSFLESWLYYSIDNNLKKLIQFAKESYCAKQAATVPDLKNQITVKDEIIKKQIEQTDSLTKMATSILELTDSLQKMLIQQQTYMIETQKLLTTLIDHLPAQNQVTHTYATEPISYTSTAGQRLIGGSRPQPQTQPASYASEKQAYQPYHI